MKKVGVRRRVRRMTKVRLMTAKNVRKSKNYLRKVNLILILGKDFPKLLLMNWPMFRIKFVPILILTLIPQSLSEDVKLVVVPHPGLGHDKVWHKE